MYMLRTVLYGSPGGHTKQWWISADGNATVDDGDVMEAMAV